MWAPCSQIFPPTRPWISCVLSTHRGLRCEGCYLHLPSPYLACPGCGLLFYCSKSCLDKDILHRGECELMGEVGELPERDDTWIIVRSIVKLQDGGGEQEGMELVEGGGEGDEVPTRPGLRTFDQLMSHQSDFLANPEGRKDFQDIYQEVEEILEERTPSFVDFMEVAGRIYINGFSLFDEEMENYGWGLYLGPSIMDHSCTPNSMVTFSGNILTVTAMKELDNLNQVKISYTDSTAPAKERREKLLTNYFFECNCFKCRQGACGPDPDWEKIRSVGGKQCHRVLKGIKKKRR